MSSSDVAGGIWKFLIGLIGFCLLAVLVFVGWLKDDVDSHLSRSAPVTAVATPAPPVPNVELPAVDVNATRIIGKSRQAIRKDLGEPKETDLGMDAFDVGEGISVGVQYYKGRGGQMVVTSSTSGVFHDSTRALEWARIPSGQTGQAVGINGKRCNVSVTDQILTVSTEEFERAQ